MPYEVEIIESLTLGGHKFDRGAVTEVMDRADKKAQAAGQQVDQLPKAIIVTVDVSHCGYVNNNKWLYTHKGMKDSVQSMVHPYRIPVMKNHNVQGEPLGRTISAEFMEMAPSGEGKVKILNAAGKEIGELVVADAYYAKDDAQYAPNVLLGPRIPTGFIRVRARITDPDAIEKILDGRYYTVSVRGAGQHVTCSIPWCKQDIGRDGLCGHKRGRVYEDNGQKAEAYWLVDGVEYKEWSYVSEPGDSYAGNRTVEVLVNGEIVKIESNGAGPETSDSVIDSFDQAAVQFFFQCGEEIGQLTFSDARENNMAENQNATPTPPVRIALADAVALDDEQFNQAIESKQIADEEMADAKLTYAQRQKLPNSAFCLVKEEDGKTVRAFPAHDAAHVRNGLARLPQSNFSPEEKAKIKGCLKSRAKKYGIKVADGQEGEKGMDFTVSDILLTDATLEDLRETDVFKAYEAEHQVSDDVQTLVTHLTAARKAEGTLKAEVEDLKRQLADKAEQVAAVTDINQELNARIHKDYARRVADLRIGLKLGDAKKWHTLAEGERGSFRDNLILDLQKKSTEYLMDALADLEDQTPAPETAPAPKEPEAKVENPGAVVSDANQSPAGVETSPTETKDPEPVNKLDRLFPNRARDAKPNRK